MTLPNFLIIGAPKSGTTSLYRYLNQHPQIYMSRLKEPHFFLYDRNCVPNCTDRVGLLRQREMVKKLSDYEKLFQGCGDAISIGESSIRYLYSQDACENIYRRIPKVKLIALLRNPVERAFSNFLRDKNRGTEPCPDFPSALADGKRRLEQEWFSGLHQHLGYYFHHLSKYYKTFEREQVRVWLYDDLVQSPSALLEEIYTFLGVDATFSADYSKRYNVTSSAIHPQIRFKIRSSIASLLPLIPLRLRGHLSGLHLPVNIKTKPDTEKMPSQIYNQLLADFSEDIKSLQDLIGRDLSHWLIEK